MSTQECRRCNCPNKYENAITQLKGKHLLRTKARGLSGPKHRFDYKTDYKKFTLKSHMLYKYIHTEKEKEQ